MSSPHPDEGLNGESKCPSVWQRYFHDTLVGLSQVKPLCVGEKWPNAGISYGLPYVLASKQPHFTKEESEVQRGQIWSPTVTE
jgi:hypothetical protein